MDIYTITIAISILVYIAICGYAGRGIKATGVSVTPIGSSIRLR